MKNKNKVRVSITIMPNLNDLVESQAKQMNISKSTLIEEAINEYFKNKLIRDAEFLSKQKFDDVFTEEEWSLIQSSWDNL